ncbi:hypothetical protein KW850_18865 [Bacillus sp. sid0103]|uniref:hypothetical protein n=1 Tax=Bacillus sp. sid0103 TaxID=2856337 RepID=UPI001C482F3F|nr:hypothetical protein [Bacillus sp. sid0103]MBV7507306.1 hypothetical protein [Bacillus sp. sid0103]
MFFFCGKNEFGGKVAEVGGILLKFRGILQEIRGISPHVGGILAEVGGILVKSNDPKTEDRLHSFRRSVTHKYGKEKGLRLILKKIRINRWKLK